MVGILRRRGLMKKTEEVNHLLYSLYNYTSRSQINTQTPVLSSDRSATVAVDITTTSNPTSSSAVSRTWKICTAWANNTRNLDLGKNGRSNSYLTVWFFGTSSQITESTAAAGRKRFVLTHEANSNTLTVYSKMGTGTVQTQTVTATYQALSTPIYVSGDTGGANQLPEGTLTSFEVFDNIWTEAQRTSFFAD